MLSVFLKKKNPCFKYSRTTTTFRCIGMSGHDCCVACTGDATAVLMRLYKVHVRVHVDVFFNVHVQLLTTGFMFCFK